MFKYQKVIKQRGDLADNSTTLQVYKYNRFQFEVNQPALEWSAKAKKITILWTQ